MWQNDHFCDENLIVVIDHFSNSTASIHCMRRSNEMVDRSKVILFATGLVRWNGRTAEKVTVKSRNFSSSFAVLELYYCEPLDHPSKEKIKKIIYMG